MRLLGIIILVFARYFLVTVAGEVTAESCREKNKEACPDFSKCVEKQYFCDGRGDCPDDGDEDEDYCWSLPCDWNGPNGGYARCDKGLCIYRSQLNDAWFADKNCIDEDAVDDEVEEGETADSCNAKGDGVCKDMSKCVAKHFMCDGYAGDCDDGSDEEKDWCRQTPCKWNDPMGTGGGFARCTTMTCLPRHQWKNDAYYAHLECGKEEDIFAIIDADSDESEDTGGAPEDNIPGEDEGGAPEDNIPGEDEVKGGAPEEEEGDNETDHVVINGGEMPGLNVTCYPTTIGITIDSSQAQDLDLSDLTMGAGDECKPEKEGDVWSFNFDASMCNPNVDEDEGKNIVYTYFITGGYETVNETIHRKQPVSIKIACKYAEDTRLTVSYTGGVSSVAYLGSSQGVFQFLFSLYQDGELSQLVQPDQQVPIGEAVYGIVEFNTTLDLFMAVQDCIASPNKDMSEPTHALIKDGCILDETLELMHDTITSIVFAYSFLAFRFKEESSSTEVFIQCMVHVCLPEEWEVLPECHHPSVCNSIGSGDDATERRKRSRFSIPALHYMT